jgi:outer membrane protein TolC
MRKMTMRSLAGACAALTIAAGGARPAAQEPTPTLTVSQAVDEALARNDRVIDQHDTDERAGLEIRSARNAFEPKIVPNIRGSFGQTDVADQTYRVDVSKRFATGTQIQGGLGTSTAQVPTLAGDLRYYNTDTTVMITQPLLKGFGVAVNRRALTSAEVHQANAARDRAILTQQITVDVASAYYRVVAQEALIQVSRQAFDRARQLRDASEAKLGAGLVSQLDVLRAQQLASQAQLQLFDAQGAAEDARDQLRFLMGRDSAASFAVATDIPRVIDDLPVEEAINRALTNRADLQSAVAEADDAARSIAYARNQLRPQVDVNFALTRRQTADAFWGSFGVDGFQFATFFTISSPVDRTPELIAYQNAFIDRDRQRRNVETLRRRIADDVRRQLRQRDRLVRNLAAVENTVELARREVEVARLRFERGLSNNLDVVTAETSLSTAESSRILALAELASGRLTLRATLGILDPRKDIAAAPAAARADDQEE